MTTSDNKLIITLLDSPAFGGAEQYIYTQLSFFAQNDFHVQVFTNNLKVKEQFATFNSASQNVKMRENLRVGRFPFVLDAIGNWKGLIKFFFWSPFAIAWLIKTIIERKKKYSQIICYWAGFSDRLLLSFPAKILGCKLIWIDISPLPPVFQRTWGFPQFLYALTKQLPDQFIVSSMTTKKSLIKDADIPPDRIHLLYPGITQFTDKEVSTYKKNGLHFRSSLPKHDILLSFVGRMASENELDVLLKAVQILQSAKKNLSYHLICIGDGPDKDKYTKLANSLGISTNVTFLGFQGDQEKRAWVAASDIFVFARAWDMDGFGMTSVEAQALEVAVITTDFGPQKEVVAKKDTGLLFQPHDFRDLARQIQFLSNSPSLRRKTAKLGRKNAARFSESALQQKALSVLELVLDY